MKEEGFSLVELLIVVAILGIISAIAVPNLLSAKKASYEASAVSYLRSWVAGQELYKRANGQYADADDDLVIGKFIGRAIIADGTADDTAYTYSIDSDNSTPNQWWGRARRRSPLLATNSYYIDQSGVIRRAAANTANVTDPPIQ